MRKYDARMTRPYDNHHVGRWTDDGQTDHNALLLLLTSLIKSAGNSNVS